MIQTEHMALAWPMEEGQVCLKCMLEKSAGFEALFFHTVEPKEVSASNPCPRCGKPYGREECSQLAQWAMDNVIMPDKEDKS